MVRIRLLLSIPLYFLVAVFFLTASPLYAFSDKSETITQTSLEPSQAKFVCRQGIIESAVTSFHTNERAIAFSNLQEESGGQPKSKGRAFLQSLLLPGWGQHYAESKTMMKIFAASEILLWGSYAGFTVWGNWLEDDYRTFSVEHANVNLANKADQYFVDIGNFNNIFEYNQAQLRDRDVADLYPETPEFFWQWDSAVNRSRFEDMRIRSDRAGNRAQFTLALILVNHLASAIHSTLAVFKFNKRLAEHNLGLNIEMNHHYDDTRISLKLSRRF